jgi:hypothetical protein
MDDVDAALDRLTDALRAAEGGPPLGATEQPEQQPEPQA